VGVFQVLFDQFSELEPLVEFAHLEQPTFRSDTGTLEAGLDFPALLARQPHSLPMTRPTG
jgi:hypothetical protein